MVSRYVKNRGGTSSVPLLTALLMGFALSSIAHADELVTVCGPYGNNVFQHSAVFGINTIGRCPNPPYSGGGLAITTAGNHVARGQNAHWQATAPAGLAIVGASVPQGSLVSAGVNDGQQYGGGFYWAGGGSQTYDGESTRSPVSLGPFSSGYLGFQLVCGVSTCTTGIPQLNIGQITLQVRETVGPVLAAPEGLWQSSGWVRGDWALHFYGDSPAGLCSLSASLNGQAIPGSASTQDPSVWHQCAAPAVVQTIHTSEYGQGGMPLTLRASDAAAVSTSDPTYTKSIYVDNSQPTVTMSGRQDAPSTAGVQYVTASAGGSPSGIAGLSCSTDAAPALWYPGSSAQLPVSGIGQHTVKCAAEDNAVDGAGNHGWSTWTTWMLSIRQPTTAALSFGSRILDALQCAGVKERVKVPAQWVIVRRHGKRVKVKRPAHTKVVTVVRCHPRVVRVRVRVRVKGRLVWRWERQVRLPHTIQLSTRRARYGATAKVVGWLGTSDGVALAGHTVRILTAPDNGLNAFMQAAAATTGQDGVWSATLQSGPSRLVEAVYDGGSTVEPTSSGQVRLIVPALVKLTIRPRRTHWWRSPQSPGTIQLAGRVLGGYIPGADQQLLRLRIGVVGVPGVQSTIGIPDIAPDGRFHTTWTPAPGNGTVHFWFSVSTLQEADFPFAPASSRRVDVIIR